LPRQVEARQVEARQVEARQVVARQVEARQVEARQVEARQVEARQVEARQVEPLRRRHSSCRSRWTRRQRPRAAAITRAEEGEVPRGEREVQVVEAGVLLGSVDKDSALQRPARRLDSFYVLKSHFTCEIAK